MTHISSLGASAWGPALALHTFLGSSSSSSSGPSSWLASFMAVSRTPTRLCWVGSVASRPWIGGKPRWPVGTRSGGWGPHYNGWDTGSSPAKELQAFESMWVGQKVCLGFSMAAYQKPKRTFWPTKYNGTCLLSLCGPLSPPYGGECTEIRNARSWFTGCSQSNWGDKTNTACTYLYSHTFRTVTVIHSAC